MSEPLLWRNRAWFVRIPLKLLILGAAVLIVCYPYPHRLIGHLRHLADPNALIDPDTPALAPWIEELSPQLVKDAPAPDVLKQVEEFVYRKVPYEWDWNTWGTADYLPTVDEVLAMGKEDCDGQAVVAASILRRLGYNARLVNDFAHVWVRTDDGDTMSPGARAVMEATEEGVTLHWNALTGLPRALAFGVAVFPLGRELIVLSVLWLLLLRRNTGLLRAAMSLALLIAGLYMLRTGSRHYQDMVAWLSWAGVATLLIGCAIPFLRPPDDRHERSIPSGTARLLQ